MGQRAAVGVAEAETDNGAAEPLVLPPHSAAEARAVACKRQGGVSGQREREGGREGGRGSVDWRGLERVREREEGGEGGGGRWRRREGGGGFDLI